MLTYYVLFIYEMVFYVFLYFKHNISRNTNYTYISIYYILKSVSAIYFNILSVSISKSGLHYTGTPWFYAPTGPGTYCVRLIIRANK